MAAVEPLRGFRITDKETFGLLNPQKNWVDNIDLGNIFLDCSLKPELKGALQVVC